MEVTFCGTGIYTPAAGSDPSNPPDVTIQDVSTSSPKFQQYLTTPLHSIRYSSANPQSTEFPSNSFSLFDSPQLASPEEVTVRNGTIYVIHNGTVVHTYPPPPQSVAKGTGPIKALFFSSLNFHSISPPPAKTSFRGDPSASQQPQSAAAAASSSSAPPFHHSPETTSTTTVTVTSTEPNGGTFTRCLCVCYERMIYIYQDTNQYVIDVPFSIDSAWPLPQGVLLRPLLPASFAQQCAFDFGISDPEFCQLFGISPSTSSTSRQRRRQQQQQAGDFSMMQHLGKQPSTDNLILSGKNLLSFVTSLDPVETFSTPQDLNQSIIPACPSDLSDDDDYDSNDSIDNNNSAFLYNNAPPRASNKTFLNHKKSHSTLLFPNLSQSFTHNASIYSLADLTMQLFEEEEDEEEDDDDDDQDDDDVDVGEHFSSSRINNNNSVKHSNKRFLRDGHLNSTVTTVLTAQYIDNPSYNLLISEPLFFSLSSIDDIRPIAVPLPVLAQYATMNNNPDLMSPLTTNNQLSALALTSSAQSDASPASPLYSTFPQSQFNSVALLSDPHQQIIHVGVNYPLVVTYHIVAKRHCVYCIQHPKQIIIERDESSSSSSSSSAAASTSVEQQALLDISVTSELMFDLVWVQPIPSFAASSAHITLASSCLSNNAFDLSQIHPPQHVPAVDATQTHNPVFSMQDFLHIELPSVGGQQRRGELSGIRSSSGTTPASTGDDNSDESPQLLVGDLAQTFREHAGYVLSLFYEQEHVLELFQISDPMNVSLPMLVSESSPRHYQRPEHQQESSSLPALPVACTLSSSDDPISECSFSTTDTSPQHTLCEQERVQDNIHTRHQQQLEDMSDPESFRLVESHKQHVLLYALIYLYILQQNALGQSVSRHDLDALDSHHHHHHHQQQQHMTPGEQLLYEQFAITNQWEKLLQTTRQLAQLSYDDDIIEQYQHVIQHVIAEAASALPSTVVNAMTDEGNNETIFTEETSLPLANFNAGQAEESLLDDRSRSSINHDQMTDEVSFGHDNDDDDDDQSSILSNNWGISSQASDQQQQNHTTGVNRGFLPHPPALLPAINPQPLFSSLAHFQTALRVGLTSELVSPRHISHPHNTASPVIPTSRSRFTPFRNEDDPHHVFQPLVPLVDSSSPTTIPYSHNQTTNHFPFASPPHLGARRRRRRQSRQSQPFQFLPEPYEPHAHRQLPQSSLSAPEIVRIIHHITNYFHVQALHIAVKCLASHMIANAPGFIWDDLHIDPSSTHKHFLTTVSCPFPSVFPESIAPFLNIFYVHDTNSIASPLFRFHTMFQASIWRYNIHNPISFHSHLAPPSTSPHSRQSLRVYLVQRAKQLVCLLSFALTDISLAATDYLSQYLPSPLLSGLFFSPLASTICSSVLPYQLNHIAPHVTPQTAQIHAQTPFLHNPMLRWLSHSISSGLLIQQHNRLQLRLGQYPLMSFKLPQLSPVRPIARTIRQSSSSSSSSLSSHRSKHNDAALIQHNVEDESNEACTPVMNIYSLLFSSHSGQILVALTPSSWDNCRVDMTTRPFVFSSLQLLPPAASSTILSSYLAPVLPCLPLLVAIRMRLAASVIAQLLTIVDSSLSHQIAVRSMTSFVEQQSKQPQQPSEYQLTYEVVLGEPNSHLSNGIFSAVYASPTTSPASMLSKPYLDPARHDLFVASPAAALVSPQLQSQSQLAAIVFLLGYWKFMSLEAILNPLTLQHLLLQGPSSLVSSGSSREGSNQQQQQQQPIWQNFLSSSTHAQLQHLLTDVVSPPVLLPSSKTTTSSTPLKNANVAVPLSHPALASLQRISTVLPPAASSSIFDTQSDHPIVISPLLFILTLVASSALSGGVSCSSLLRSVNTLMSRPPTISRQPLIPSQQALSHALIQSYRPESLFVRLTKSILPLCHQSLRKDTTLDSQLPCVDSNLPDDLAVTSLIDSPTVYNTTIQSLLSLISPLFLSAYQFLYQNACLDTSSTDQQMILTQLIASIQCTSPQRLPQLEGVEKIPFHSFFQYIAPAAMINTSISATPFNLYVDLFHGHLQHAPTNPLPHYIFSQLVKPLSIPSLSHIFDHSKHKQHQLELSELYPVLQLFPLSSPFCTATKTILSLLDISRQSHWPVSSHIMQSIVGFARELVATPSHAAAFIEPKPIDEQSLYSAGSTTAPSFTHTNLSKRQSNPHISDGILHALGDFLHCDLFAYLDQSGVYHDSVGPGVLNSTTATFSTAPSTQNGTFLHAFPDNFSTILSSSPSSLESTLNNNNHTGIQSRSHIIALSPFSSLTFALPVAIASSYQAHPLQVNPMQPSGPAPHPSFPPPPAQDIPRNHLVSTPAFSHRAPHVVASQSRKRRSHHRVSWNVTSAGRQDSTQPRRLSASPRASFRRRSHRSSHHTALSSLRRVSQNTDDLSTAIPTRGFFSPKPISKHPPTVRPSVPSVADGMDQHSYAALSINPAASSASSSSFAFLPSIAPSHSTLSLQSRAKFNVHIAAMTSQGGFSRPHRVSNRVALPVLLQPSSRGGGTSESPRPYVPSSHANQTAASVESIVTSLPSEFQPTSTPHLARNPFSAVIAKASATPGLTTLQHPDVSSRSARHTARYSANSQGYHNVLSLNDSQITSRFSTTASVTNQPASAAMSTVLSHAFTSATRFFGYTQHANQSQYSPDAIPFLTVQIPPALTAQFMFAALCAFNFEADILLRLPVWAALPIARAFTACDASYDISTALLTELIQEHHTPEPSQGLDDPTLAVQNTQSHNELLSLLQQQRTVEWPMKALLLSGRDDIVATFFQSLFINNDAVMQFNQRNHLVRVSSVQTFPWLETIAETIVQMQLYVDQFSLQKLGQIFSRYVEHITMSIVKYHPQIHRLNASTFTTEPYSFTNMLNMMSAALQNAPSELIEHLSLLKAISSRFQLQLPNLSELFAMISGKNEISTPLVQQSEQLSGNSPKHSFDSPLFGLQSDGTVNIPVVHWRPHHEIAHYRVHLPASLPISSFMTANDIIQAIFTTNIHQDLNRLDCYIALPSKHALSVPSNSLPHPHASQHTATVQQQTISPQAHQHHAYCWVNTNHAIPIFSHAIGALCHTAASSSPYHPITVNASPLASQQLGSITTDPQTTMSSSSFPLPLYFAPSGRTSILYPGSSLIESSCLINPSYVALLSPIIPMNFITDLEQARHVVVTASSNDMSSVSASKLVQEPASNDYTRNIPIIAGWFFPNDQRLNEITRMLSSSRPPSLTLTKWKLKMIAQRRRAEERELMHCLAERRSILAERQLSLWSGRSMYLLSTRSPHDTTGAHDIATNIMLVGDMVPEICLDSIVKHDLSFEINIFAWYRGIPGFGKQQLFNVISHLLSLPFHSTQLQTTRKLGYITRLLAASAAYRQGNILAAYNRALDVGVDLHTWIETHPLIFYWRLFHNDSSSANYSVPVHNPAQHDLDTPHGLHYASLRQHLGQLATASISPVLARFLEKFPTFDSIMQLFLSSFESQLLTMLTSSHTSPISPFRTTASASSTSPDVLINAEWVRRSTERPGHTPILRHGLIFALGLLGYSVARDLEFIHHHLSHSEPTVLQATNDSVIKTYHVAEEAKQSVLLSLAAASRAQARAEITNVCYDILFHDVDVSSTAIRTQVEQLAAQNIYPTVSFMQVGEEMTTFVNNDRNISHSSALITIGLNNMSLPTPHFNALFLSFLTLAAASFSIRICAGFGLGFTHLARGKTGMQRSLALSQALLTIVAARPTPSQQNNAAKYTGQGSQRNTNKRPGLLARIRNGADSRSAVAPAAAIQLDPTWYIDEFTKMSAIIALSLMFCQTESRDIADVLWNSMQSQVVLSKRITPSHVIMPQSNQGQLDSSFSSSTPVASATQQHRNRHNNRATLPARPSPFVSHLAHSRVIPGSTVLPTRAQHEEEQQHQQQQQMSAAIRENMTPFDASFVFADNHQQQQQQRQSHLNQQQLHILYESTTSMSCYTLVPSARTFQNAISPSVLFLQRPLVNGFLVLARGLICWQEIISSFANRHVLLPKFLAQWWFAHRRRHNNSISQLHPIDLSLLHVSNPNNALGLALDAWISHQVPKSVAQVAGLFSTFTDDLVMNVQSDWLNRIVQYEQSQQHNHHGDHRQSVHSFAAKASSYAVTSSIPPSHDFDLDDGIAEENMNRISVANIEAQQLPAPTPTIRNNASSSQYSHDFGLSFRQSSSSISFADHSVSSSLLSSADSFFPYQNNRGLLNADASDHPSMHFPSLSPSTSSSSMSLNSHTYSFLNQAVTSPPSFLDDQSSSISQPGIATQPQTDSDEAFFSKFSHQDRLLYASVTETFTSTLREVQDHLQPLVHNYLAIVSHACFAIGLRFAGTQNIQVRDVLLHYLGAFHALRLFRNNVTARGETRRYLAHLSGLAWCQFFPAGAPPHVIHCFDENPTPYAHLLRVAQQRTSQLHQQRRFSAQTSDFLTLSSQHSASILDIIRALDDYILILTTGIVATAVALVMAGSADETCLVMIRRVRRNTDPLLTYAQHNQISQALGLLSIGGCAMTIDSTSPSNIGLLLMALFPRYTNTLCQNNDYLHILRFMHVLTVSPRNIVVMDLNNQAQQSNGGADLANTRPLAATLRFVLRDAHYVEVESRSNDQNEPTQLQLIHSQRVVYQTAPCLLPPLESIVSLTISAHGYAPLHLSPSLHPQHAYFLFHSRTVYLKRIVPQLLFAPPIPRTLLHYATVQSSQQISLSSGGLVHPDVLHLLMSTASITIEKRAELFQNLTLALQCLPILTVNTILTNALIQNPHPNASPSKVSTTLLQMLLSSFNMSDHIDSYLDPAVFSIFHPGLAVLFASENSTSSAPPPGTKISPSIRAPSTSTLHAGFLQIIAAASVASSQSEFQAISAASSFDNKLQFLSTSLFWSFGAVLSSLYHAFILFQTHNVSPHHNNFQHNLTCDCTRYLQPCLINPAHLAQAMHPFQLVSPQSLRDLLSAMSFLQSQSSFTTSPTAASCSTDHTYFFINSVKRHLQLIFKVPSPPWISTQESSQQSSRVENNTVVPSSTVQVLHHNILFMLRIAYRLLLVDACYGMNSATMTSPIDLLSIAPSYLVPIFNPRNVLLYTHLAAKNRSVKNPPPSPFMNILKIQPLYRNDIDLPSQSTIAPISSAQFPHVCSICSQPAPQPLAQPSPPSSASNVCKGHPVQPNSTELALVSYLQCFILINKLPSTPQNTTSTIIQILQELSTHIVSQPRVYSHQLRQFMHRIQTVVSTNCSNAHHLYDLLGKMKQHLTFSLPFNIVTTPFHNDSSHLIMNQSTQTPPAPSQTSFSNSFGLSLSTSSTSHNESLQLPPKTQPSPLVIPFSILVDITMHITQLPYDVAVLFLSAIGLVDILY